MRRSASDVPGGTGTQRPVGLQMLFPPIFVMVYLLHATLLRLPYFWDEAGYYIPAAWDFLRLGTLIPETTVRNAHPPLPSILLAGWWKIAGFSPYSTRLLVCLVAAAALLAIFRIGRLLLGDAAAAALLALTAIYPVWFAQSTLAHADLFAAALSLWAISCYLDRERWTGHAEPAANAANETANAISTAVLFCLAAMAKETAIVTPGALFLYELWLWRRKRSRPGLWLPALAAPVLPLAAWFAYHRARTGFAFGNPEFLRYNASANLSAARILLSLWHRLIHLTVHMNLFVPVLAAIAVLLLPARQAARPLSRDARTALVAVLVAHWLAFSVLGGALLTRYLLVAYPLLLLLCIATWQRHTRWWPAIAAASLAAFAVGCEVNPPYPFAPEDNLSYRDMIVLHQQAIRVLQQRLPAGTVLTAWPVAGALERPELGYVTHAVRVVEIQNFSAAEIARAAGLRGSFDAAIVFSTKYDPPPGTWNLANSQQADVRFYDYHRDLTPEEVARNLGATVLWRGDRKGQWAAVLAMPPQP